MKTITYLCLWYDSMGNDFKLECISWKGREALLVDGGNDLLVIFPCAHPGQRCSSFGNSISGNPFRCFRAFCSTSLDGCAMSARDFSNHFKPSFSQIGKPDSHDRYASQRKTPLPPLYFYPLCRITPRRTKNYIVIGEDYGTITLGIPMGYTAE